MENIYIGSAAHKADLALREVMVSAIRRSGLSREQIADQLSDILGVRISPIVLNSYLCPSKPGNRLPASYVVAFCQAVGNDLLLRELLSPEYRHLLELGAVALALLRDQLNSPSSTAPSEIHEEALIAV